MSDLCQVHELQHAISYSTNRPIRCYRDLVQTKISDAVTVHNVLTKTRTLVQSTVQDFSSDPSLRAGAEKFREIEDCMITLRDSIRQSQHLIKEIDYHMQRLAKAYETWLRTAYLHEGKMLGTREQTDSRIVINTFYMNRYWTGGLRSGLELIAQLHEEWLLKPSYGITSETSTFNRCIDGSVRGFKLRKATASYEMVPEKLCGAGISDANVFLWVEPSAEDTRSRS